VSTTQPFTSSKQVVYAALKAVKAKAGAAGVDEQSLGDFEKALQDQLYKVWNRMASGRYFPPPVKAVTMPQKQGGERMLGMPTVADRVAQMVVKMPFASAVEPVFLADSYGYRPGKSAVEAVGVTRQRCWRDDWVLAFDITGLFDNIAQALLLRAVHKQTQGKWVRLYRERWRKAPRQLAEGPLVERTKGTPQGGVVTLLTKLQTWC
jgi:RNA-directed DNA polymerase